MNLIIRMTFVALALAGGSGSVLQETVAQAAGQTKAPQPMLTMQQPAQTGAQIEAKNRKITESNAVVTRTFTAGNEALLAGRLDEAIAAYHEGLQARADEPALLTNLSEALRRRGSKRWNEMLVTFEKNARTQRLDAAKKDWAEASAFALKALEAINAHAAASPPRPPKLQTKLSATEVRALAMRLVATKVDRSQAQPAWNAYAEYIALVSDPAKKSKLNGEALQMLFEAEAFDQATIQSRAILKVDPEHLEANRVLGLSLFATGDKVKYREAAVHLQRYLDKAPDTDPLKKSAREALEFVNSKQ
jgi:hypothetical protein